MALTVATRGAGAGEHPRSTEDEEAVSLAFATNEISGGGGGGEHPRSTEDEEAVALAFAAKGISGGGGGGSVACCMIM